MLERLVVLTSINARHRCTIEHLLGQARDHGLRIPVVVADENDDALERVCARAGVSFVCGFAAGDIGRFRPAWAMTLDWPGPLPNLPHGRVIGSRIAPVESMLGVYSAAFHFIGADGAPGPDFARATVSVLSSESNDTAREKALWAESFWAPYFLHRVVVARDVALDAQGDLRLPADWPYLAADADSPTLDSRDPPPIRAAAAATRRRPDGPLAYQRLLGQ